MSLSQYELWSKLLQEGHLGDYVGKSWCLRGIPGVLDCSYTGTILRNSQVAVSINSERLYAL